METAELVESVQESTIFLIQHVSEHSSTQRFRRSKTLLLLSFLNNFLIHEDQSVILDTTYYRHFVYFGWMYGVLTKIC